ncbi:MAG: DUF2442 domain-containing protein [Opitutae bacterium]|nr:DUF2442 domain-containing protein [Opitutae bacterium]
MKFALAKVVTVKALPKHRLALAFSDGMEGVYDCTSHLWGEMFEPLKDQKFFAKVALDHGAPTWPNGADLDPGVLREAIANQTPIKAKRAVLKARLKGKLRVVAEEAAPYPSRPRR